MLLAPYRRPVVLDGLVGEPETLGDLPVAIRIGSKAFGERRADLVHFGWGRGDWAARSGIRRLSRFCRIFPRPYLLGCRSVRLTIESACPSF